MSADLIPKQDLPSLDRLTTVVNYLKNKTTSPKAPTWGLGAFKTIFNMRTKHFMTCAASLAVGLALMVACGDSEEPAGSGTSPALTDESDLEKALYCIKYAIQVSTDYNDKGLRPSSISGVASVSYTASTLLDYMTFSAMKTTTIAAFRTDVGRRPGAIGETSSSTAAIAAATTVYNGTYKFDEDPAHILVYFGGYSGSSKFAAPSSLKDVSLLDYYKLLTNGDAFTSEISSSMWAFPNNCYKIIVYGKNKAGKVIGKYVGYSTGSSYEYWCINPENGNYGKSGTKAL
ncbi:MAG: hypothetical protein LBT48_07795 [Prevotellaceae bacterium]|jgi:hypothetical protein|nr:hypothetical protein [Prevotellaceae bacterium]